MVQTVHVGVSDTSKPRLPHHPDVQIILCNLLQSAEWSHADPHQNKSDPEYASDRSLSSADSHHYDRNYGSAHHEQNSMGSQIWCIIILLHSFSVHLLCKTPGASKIIFCSGSADCGIFIITVNIEFHFTFAPPVTFQCGKCNISSYIMTFSFYSVKDCIIFLLLCQSLSPPLCMEISDIIRKLIIQTVIYLIEECRNFICMLIFQSVFLLFS